MVHNRDRSGWSLQEWAIFLGLLVVGLLFLIGSEWLFPDFGFCCRIR